MLRQSIAFQLLWLNYPAKINQDSKEEVILALQTLKIGKREFVLLPKSDFDKLAAQARRQSEDEYWTESALRAEAKARAKGESPIAFETVEAEIDARKAPPKLRKKRPQ